MAKKIFLGALLITNIACAQEVSDLTKLSLEQLGAIEVSTASRKDERLSDTPASVFVLTSEDIRRSGANSIPEALRLVPGLAVARSNATTWAISARGFNDIFANKLLVMVDGRTVYSPIFSGTYWDSQDYNLSDIERIEVVKGSGGTLWGANAVNGIINIITKSAKDTKGTEISVGAGNEDGSAASVRYGSQLSSESDYRIYAKMKKIKGGELADSKGSAHDQGQMMQGGFRIDGDLDSDLSYSLHGDAYHGLDSLVGSKFSEEPPFVVPYSTHSPLSGGNLVGHLDIQTAENAKLSLQGYVDRVNRASFLDGFHGTTYDLDLQHRFEFGPHALTYGLAYRVVDDRFYGNDLLASVEPNSRVYRNYSGFVQGDLELVKDELSLIIGSKYEHSELGGGELSPNVRMLWKLGGDTVVWGAASRAVRAVSRAQYDASLDVTPFDPQFGNLPGISRLYADPTVNTESYSSYEIGARFKASEDISFDISTFQGNYNELVLIKYGEPFVGEVRGHPSVIQPLYYSNDGNSEALGLELFAEWHGADWARVLLGYSYLDVNVSVPDGNAYVDLDDFEKDYPAHQVVLRGQFNIYDIWEFDTILRFVDQLSAINIDSYFDLDLRLGLKLRSDMEISIMGQNLLEPNRKEFSENALGVPASLVGRGVYGRFTWRF